MAKISPLIQWWVTPKLPPEDVFARHNPITQWIIHPIKRRLARAYLKHLKTTTGIKVIGITGSTGKTTTTEILSSILSGVGPTVWSAQGVDPVYNIPNTILKAGLSTKYLVLEMSVEYANEMDYYLWLAKPDLGVITNITTTHTQFLKDKKGVASEKSKLIKALEKGGIAVLNKEDGLVNKMGQGIRAKVVYFGSKSEVVASNIKLNNDLSTDFTLKLGKNTKSVHIKALGSQFVSNALAAAAASDALGVKFQDIVRGIEKFMPPAHRLNVFISKSNGLIFDDTYNSNPKAAEESLDTFKAVSKGKKKIAVIGDMLELGKYEEAAHRDLGKKAGEVGFFCLIGVGNAARFVVEEASGKIGRKNCFLVGNYEEALGIIKHYIDKDSAVFVKGSRFLHLDKLVEAIS